MNKFLRLTSLLSSVLIPVFVGVAVFSFFIKVAQATDGTIEASNRTSLFCTDDSCTTGSKILWVTDNGAPVKVTDSALSGDIWGENVGWINLSPDKGGVVNTLSGILSGYAWGENAGWINFKPDNGGVSINTSTGEFSGFAWSQNNGWIKFTCPGTNTCVVTNWRPTITPPQIPQCPSPPGAGPCETDLCSNLDGIQTSMPVGYLPDVLPGHLGECMQIVNNLVVQLNYPPDKSNFLSADASQTEIDASSPSLTLANFKIQAQVVSGSANKVEFFEQEGSVDNNGVFAPFGVETLLGTVSNAPYEIPWNKSVMCDDPTQPKNFHLKVRASDFTGLITSEAGVVVQVGRVPCAIKLTQCSDIIDNDGDGLVDEADPGCHTIVDDAVCQVPAVIKAGEYDPCLNSENPPVDICSIDPNIPVCFCLKSENKNDPKCTPPVVCESGNELINGVCVLIPDILPTVDVCLGVGGDSIPGCQTVLAMVKGAEVDVCKDPNSIACLKKNDLVNSLLKNIALSYLPSKTVKALDLGLKVASTTSAVMGVTLSLGTMLFLNPLSFQEIFLIPLRLWSLLLSALGIRKRARPWGTVYDSVTKQPLDPVYVSLYNLEGMEVASSITDIDGRYGFLVPPGVYKVMPKKTNYLFPSEALSKHFNDEFYRDLYFGDYMNIGEGEVIVKNIPLDPVNFDWNEFAKNKQQLFRFYSKRELWIARISNWLFTLGFTVATVALILSPEKYNIVIFGLYIVMFIIRRTSFKLKAKGRALGKDGTPLSFAIIRVLSAETNVEIAHTVVDSMGRYHLLVPNGSYYVKIENKNDDASYSLIYTSGPFKVIHGILNRVFNA